MTPKINVLRSVETSEAPLPMTQRDVTDDLNPQPHHCEKLKCHITKLRCRVHFNFRIYLLTDCTDMMASLPGPERVVTITSGPGSGDYEKGKDWQHK